MRKYKGKTYYTVKEAAEYAEVERYCIQRGVNAGKIEQTAIPTKTKLIHIEEVKRWMRENMGKKGRPKSNN